MTDNYKNMGLTSAEVEKRVREGKVNNAKHKTTKSYRHILFENIFSIFNFLNLAIALVLFYVGSFKNCLFMIVVLCNTVIGIIQEIRSKRTIDKLSIINQSKVNVIRDGERSAIDRAELVLDDIIILETGEQVPNDCELIDGVCEANESLITGEADSIYKEKGSSLFSGSYIVSGRCFCRVVKVGSENYADSILGQIKYVKKTNSEIVRVIKRIILVISIMIVPLSFFLFMNQFTLLNASLKEAVENSAAAIIGMIPEGLVLLISTVFALGVIRLSKRNVLSQDLYSLESLARTDVLCLDKTGTITTGEMVVADTVVCNGIEKEYFFEAVNTLSYYSRDNSSTILAVQSAFTDKPESEMSDFIPFSSERKWSAVSTKNNGTFIMGAAEMIFGAKTDYSALDESTKEKYRIVAVSHSKSIIADKKIPEDVCLLGYILLSEKVRDSISETFEYFQSQDVSLKIISGDNPVTVSRMCKGAFGGKLGKCVDMSKVKDNEIPELVESNDIFGRVTPNQKRLIITSLKKKGHTVGMIGDGVNDVLALKESDCSIGLANGSEAARNVSQLVLMDSDFRSLPNVVSEGRRSINNLQNSAALFLSKTIFSAVMTFIFMFAEFSYPFQPIQMTLISALTIGMPSFVLSFEKNNRRISGSFLRNIINSSVPSALTNIVTIMLTVIFAGRFSLTDSQVSSLAVLSFAITGMLLIVHIYKPLDKLRLFIICVSLTGFLLAFAVFYDFFGLSYMSVKLLLLMAAVAASAAVLFNLLLRLFNTNFHRKNKKSSV